MPAIAMVLYPNGDDAKFDMDYYLDTHMPLVMEQWGPLGLKSWEIASFGAALKGSKPEYLVQAYLVWESQEHCNTATDAEADAAKAVFGDVPNFTNTSPTVLLGGVVKSSQNT